MVSNKVYKFCSEDISLIENYEEAIKDEEMWHCHHRKETDEGYSRQELIDMDLYFNRPSNELIFITRKEHFSLHHKGKHLSEEQKKKISETLKGYIITEETRKKLSNALKGKNKGKHLSEEQKKKLSQTLKGTHLSEETKAKISKSHKGKIKSAEHRRHLSEALKGKKHLLGRHWHKDPNTGKHVYDEK